MAGVTDQFGPVLQRLLTIADQALTDAGTPVGLASLAPGNEVAWDGCGTGDCDGQLWVRLIEMFPTRNFPALDPDQNCGPQTLALRVGVGVVRCAHTLDNDGTPPSADDMTGDTRAITTDATTILNAVECALPAGPIVGLRLVRWLSLGPQGGCAGGEWELLVGVDWCGCS